MDVKGMTDETSLSPIRIDKNGIWYYKGSEMFRKEIVNYFYSNLRQDISGKYMIVLENDHCYLDVEDTAFVVKSINTAVTEKDGRRAFYLLLSDDTVEALDPESLWIGKENILYCTVKNSRFEARFLRPAYYQMADHIEHDEKRDCYFIQCSDGCHDIRNSTPVATPEKHHREA